MSRYQIYVTPSAVKEIRNLPGQIRQRARKAVTALADNPRPPKSKMPASRGDSAFAIFRYRSTLFVVLAATYWTFLIAIGLCFLVCAKGTQVAKWLRVLVVGNHILPKPPASEP